MVGGADHSVAVDGGEAVERGVHAGLEHVGVVFLGVLAAHIALRLVLEPLQRLMRKVRREPQRLKELFLFMVKVVVLGDEDLVQMALTGLL